MLYTCSLVVMMIAGVLSSLSQQHASLLWRQIIRHFCLKSATGVASAFLIHLLITPPGHRKSQSRERCSDQCCPTGDLLSGWHLDIRRLLSSHRQDKKKKKKSKDTREALLQLRALKRLCGACYPPVVITFCMRLSSSQFGVIFDLKATGGFRGQETGYDFKSTAGLTEGLMQMRSF